MSELTPDAACDAFRAVMLIREWMHERFVTYVRKHLPSQKKLLATLSPKTEQGSMEERIPRLVENGFYKMLGLKTELGALPSSGPVVSSDDLYFCAGVIMAAFVEDMEKEGVAEQGLARRAMKWRPKDLRPSEGALNAALLQVAEETGIPDMVTAMIIPLLMMLVASQPCLQWPSPRRSAGQELTKLSHLLPDVLQKYDVTLEQLSTKGDAVRELIKRSTTRAEFDQMLGTHLFPTGEKEMDGLERGMRVCGEALLDYDPDASAGAEELLAHANDARSVDRATRIAFGVFLRNEAETIWGKGDVSISST